MDLILKYFIKPVVELNRKVVQWAIISFWPLMWGHSHTSFPSHLQLLQHCSIQTIVREVQKTVCTDGPRAAAVEYMQQLNCKRLSLTESWSSSLHYILRLLFMKLRGTQGTWELHFLFLFQTQYLLIGSEVVSGRMNWQGRSGQVQWVSSLESRLKYYLNFFCCFMQLNW